MTDLLADSRPQPPPPRRRRRPCCSQPGPDDSSHAPPRGAAGTGAREQRAAVRQRKVETPGAAAARPALCCQDCTRILSNVTLYTYHSILHISYPLYHFGHSGPAESRSKQQTHPRCIILRRQRRRRPLRAPLCQLCRRPEHRWRLADRRRSRLVPLAGCHWSHCSRYHLHQPQPQPAATVTEILRLRCLTAARRPPPRPRPGSPGTRR